MRMLQAVASFHPKPLTKQQIAALVGFSYKGGTFTTYLGELKRNAWLSQQGSLIAITPEGMAAVGEIQPISRKHEDILQLWVSKFRAGAGNMLTELANVYPDAITKEELGNRTGMSHTGGTFTTYLGELKRNGLIEVTGKMVKASPSSSRSAHNQQGETLGHRTDRMSRLAQHSGNRTSEGGPTERLLGST
jgi:uncharacterized protein